MQRKLSLFFITFSFILLGLLQGNREGSQGVVFTSEAGVAGFPSQKTIILPDGTHLDQEIWKEVYRDGTIAFHS